MSIRILSGVLKVNQDSLKKGRATIDFDEFGATGDAKLVNSSRVGAAAVKFQERPCVAVGLQRFDLWDSSVNGNREAFDISYDVDENKIVVSWSGTGRIREISVLVSGRPAT